MVVARTDSDKQVFETYLVGDTTPKIQFKASGSAEFKGDVKIGTGPKITMTASTGGSAFLGSMGIGGSIGDPNIELNASGFAVFTGNVTAPNVTFRLDADDPNAYETREEQYTETETYKGPRGNELLTREVTKTREVTEYVGETMDVKSVLLKLTGALETLKTAAASATTCEELRTAIETALADV